MPLRINRVARGLLSYLDSKNAGQPPQFVADEIAAIITTDPFLFANQAVDLFGDVAAASTGAVGIALASNFGGVGGGAFRVPPGEIWLVQNVTARMAVLPAGTEYQFSVGYQPVSGSASGLWNGLEQSNAIGTWPTGCAPLACSSLSPPVVMIPGDQFGIFISRLVVGVAQKADMNARCIRLQF